MARKSKKDQPRIISPRGQARNAVGPRLRIGESRHAAKASGEEKGLIYSRGTKRVAIERLTQVAQWLQERGKRLTDLTPEVAKEYLNERQRSCAIKTLKSDVQQIKNHLAFRGQKLDYKVHVPRLTNCRTRAFQTGGKVNRPTGFDEVSLAFTKIEGNRLMFSCPRFEMLSVYVLQPYSGFYCTLDLEQNAKLRILFHYSSTPTIHCRRRMTMDRGFTS